MSFVSVNAIKEGERQRTLYKNIEELAESIKRHGIIQPIVVDEDMNLIAGGRRLRAAKKAELKIVPVVVRENITPLEKEELELEENLQRVDLSWDEECDAKKKIDKIKKQLHGERRSAKDTEGWSMRKTAELLGETIGSTSQDIALADAMEIMPELRKCKTKTDAQKMFAKVLESASIRSMIKQKDEQKTAYFRHAEHHYLIGDAKIGLAACNQTQCRLAIVDPPYAVGLDKNKKVSTVVSSSGQENLDNYQEVDLPTYTELCTTISQELYRVLADNAWVVWWFGIQHYHLTYDILINAGFEVDPIPNIWTKTGSTGQTHKFDYQLGRTYEMFFACRKGTPALAKRGRANVFDFKPVPSQKKIHPTEKPIDLCLEILDTYLFPGSLAIVPFLGSGVDLRALYMRGSTGFGWDLDQNNELKNKFLAKVLVDEEKGLYGKQS